MYGHIAFVVRTQQQEKPPNRLRHCPRWITQKHRETEGTVLNGRALTAKIKTAAFHGFVHRLASRSFIRFHRNEAFETMYKIQSQAIPSER